ncbi:SusC/RagA family TonB-linked outer membrane protein [uncultured Chitinophaga sp.]|jgi:TonB-linked outer membrane protein, SusC/RagA family|uniref:SusC/RagA family TonB-linked outer membrane protein n=1 Tax=uncultured Chitinophaga sp. TaxID=339340 RepID=UPI00263557D0|nr:SusC/RagA family TonB-linked outer membrane protein [uncultured Chitinophaga sp.]
MKLNVLLLTAIILLSGAVAFAQKVTLKEKNLPLDQVFNKVSAQTGYDFLYTTSLLKSARPVTIDVRDADLNTVLKTIFANQPLNFSIEDKSVVVTPKTPPTQPSRQPGLSATIDVTGRVTDADAGTPLSGATVLVKGSWKGTSTAADGSFRLNGVEENAPLLVSFIGYKTRELSAAADLGTIRMEVAINTLDKVAVTVNTGYQRIKPEQSTGAVAQISTKAYESRVSSNFLDGLANRLPGLLINNNVSFTSTTPGSTGSTSRSLFNIRGISTMSANQNPLIVLDGYPTELTIDMIDPNEIKSVTILKDAAAATVYGVRASNGVIVIERKQATAGKPKFAFRTTLGIRPKENYHRYRYADDGAAVYADFEKSIYSASVNPDSWYQLAAIGSGYSQSYSPVYYLLAQSAAKVITPAQFASSYAALQSYDNRDEYSKLLQRAAITQTYNLSASGGNENALYYITANYTGNRLTARNNNNNRWLLSGRSNLKLSSRLSLELITDYQELRTNGAPVPSLSDLFPYEHLQDVNGQPVFASSGSEINPFYNNSLKQRGLPDVLYYPLVDVDQISDKTRTVNNHFTANFNYNIGKGFSLLFGGIYENSRTEFRHYASESSSQARVYVAQYTSVNPDGTLKYNIPQGGYLNQETSHTYSYTARTQLNYNKRFGTHHSFNGILGTELRNVVSKSSLASYFGYSDETLLQQPVDYAGITNGIIRGVFITSSPFYNAYNSLFNQTYTEDRFLSGFANAVYSYDDTYSLSGSVRIDQSNLFGTNPKYKYKPLWSVGAAWNINREQFMRQAYWVDELKLRAAYGFNGNVAKLSLPQAIAQYTLNMATLPTSTALTLLSYANSSLRWEQTKNFNVGLDYRIFKHISGTLDYYFKKSSDLLGNSLIDPTIGLSPSIINKATINNKGIELSLHADWIARRDFNWNTGLVLARNTSKVLDVYQQGVYNPQTLNVLGYVKGYPVGGLFAYRDAGLSSAGFPLVKNEQGKVYETDDSSTGSQQSMSLNSDTSGVTRYVGSAIPTINAGLSNRFDIGKCYVFVMVNYYGGFKVRIPRPDPSALRPLEGAGNYWRKPGDENYTDIPALEALYSNGNSNAANAYNFSDKYVVNGDYITLADVTLSYSFDDWKFVKRSGFSHVEVKLQGSNLWTHGFNRYNYSPATESFQKAYITPTYTLAIFTNF